jgi:hypothetical protein
MADPVSHYTFLPWYRTGLASAVQDMEADRGKLDVTIHARIGAAPEDFKRTVHLIGPGDVIGIDPRSVVRVEPRPFSNDFEPNYLAAIEFFDEDYAWRYSPRGPEAIGKGRLAPWIALLVLETGEFEIADQGQGLPRALKIPDTSVLPSPEESWAWAHAHLNGVVVDPGNPRATADQIAANPAASCCRVVAARHLMPLKAYHAFLVPAFDAGRRAALLDGGPAGSAFSWKRGTPAVLPIYYEWTFRTSEEGDFKELALRLKARAADPSIGRRPIDVSRPLENAAFPPIRNEAIRPRAVLDLEGALQVPGAQHSSWQATSKAAFQKRLADFINLGESWEIKDLNSKVEGEPPLPHGIKLPVILPPAYGRFHANVSLLEPAKADSRWLEQLNLDPRNRVAAAYGTLVVQKNQEEFMARAWKQYGEVLEANGLRLRGQLFREILTAMDNKHFRNLTAERTLAVTGPMHARMLEPGETRLTVLGRIQSSVLPAATTRPAMRRILRDDGPVSRRFGTRTPHLANIISDVASGRASISPPWTQPGERINLAKSPAVPAVPGAVQWLGSDWDLLKPMILAYIAHTALLAPRFPQLTQNILFLNEVLKQGDLQSSLSTASLTPAAVSEVREAPQWAPPSVDPHTLRPEELAPALENRNFSFVAWNFRQAALNATELLTIPISQPAQLPALDVAGTAKNLHTQLSPYLTVSERLGRWIKLPPAIRIVDYDPLERIMAHPRFDDATYELLKKISEEYVIPNLSKIGNNTITLLEVNWYFVESFLVGLNHEMARELLWRRYFTDQRGSYFRLFWDARVIPGSLEPNGKVKETALDIHPIHGWKLGGELTPLGGNRPKGRPDVRNLVLVIRGDLLRRYPNTQVYAARAVPNPQPRKEFDKWNRRPEEDNDGDVLHPMLFAKFDPDIYCYGFNLQREQAMGKPVPETSDLGWYFALAERYGEPRFGLDAGPLTVLTPTKADELNWGHIAADPDNLIAIDPLVNKPTKPDLITSPGRKAIWGNDSADLASILLREPSRVYYHANDMLTEGR